MSQKRSLLILGILAIIIMVMLSGLPLASLVHARPLNASYSELSAETLCGGPSSNQIRVYTSADVFADPGLTQKLFTAANVEGKNRQKFLVCDDSLGKSVLRIFIGTTTGYISVKAGDVVPRNYTDNQ